MKPPTATTPLRRVWIAVGVLAVLCAVGLVIRNHRLNAARGRSGANGGAVKAAACVPTDRHASIAPLQLTEVHARRLAQEQRYDEAIALYRDIAKTDPAFPGIQLDLSVALLEAKQVQPAGAAIDAQLATSSCLIALPQEQLETYCSSEMPNLSVPACRQQVTGLQRTAHLQAALVQMQLGRNDATQAGAQR